MKKMSKARGKTYGDYQVQAQLAQDMKERMRQHPKWDKLPAVVKESFEMMVTKMTRSVNGDPGHLDNYDDIAGYALLPKKYL